MQQQGNHDLLVLGCSHKKQAKPGPALEVYDGPLFRTIRRRMKEINTPLDIFVVSARYGIIDQMYRIEPYDEVLPHAFSPDYALMLKSQMNAMLPFEWERVLILAPSHYVQHLPLESLRSRSARLDVYSGRLGKCQANLLEWLGIEYKSEDRKPNSLGPLFAFNNPLDMSNILTVSRMITASSKSTSRVTQWYACIDDKKVPVKRLVSAITGVPVSAFDTCHALALLHRNGIETCRVGIQ